MILAGQQKISRTLVLFDTHPGGFTRQANAPRKSDSKFRPAVPFAAASPILAKNDAVGPTFPKFFASQCFCSSRAPRWI